MRHRQRFLGACTAVVLGAASLVSGLVAAAPASATATTRSATKSLSGSTSVAGPTLTETSLSDVTISAGALTGSLSWSQVASVSTQFDSDAVRQGSAVDPVDSITRTRAGTMVVNWSLPDLMVGWPGYGPFDVGTIGLSPTGTCNLQFGGGTYTCHLESTNSTIIDTNPSPGPYVKAKLVADVTITPQALATLRSASVGGTPIGTANLALGESSVTDSLTIPCSATVGQHLNYGLGALSTAPGIAVVPSLQVEVGTSTIDPNNASQLLYQPTASPSFPFSTLSTSVTVNGSATTPFDLGAVQADATLPVAVAGGPYSGAEGSAIDFDGSASTSGCGTPTLHWTFSDGGTADGAHPSHTFADNGSYTGTLTVTDGNGHTDTDDFSVTVANVAPSADAGAGTSADWGRTVSFSGSATDPSSLDQSSLQYTWDFGDGSATEGGADATHAYATPAVGGYDATLTVCDKDGDCGSDVRHVTVTKRDTTTSYTGDGSGTFGDPATLKASLVDEYGQPIGGQAVAFQVGTDGPFSATTNGNGVASTSYTPTLAANTYSDSSSFAGDELYKASSTSNSFVVNKQPTAISYGGDLSSRPNKSVVLQATLVDGHGAPLAGRSVEFQLGTQSASAVTDANGVASTELKLKQKNGSYTLVASYNPNSTDDPYYLGASDSAIFKLQVK
jgi:PKD repeat protein